MVKLTVVSATTTATITAVKFSLTCPSKSWHFDNLQFIFFSLRPRFQHDWRQIIAGPSFPSRYIKLTMLQCRLSKVIPKAELRIFAAVVCFQRITLQLHLNPEASCQCVHDSGAQTRNIDKREAVLVVVAVIGVNTLLAERYFDSLGLCQSTTAAQLDRPTCITRLLSFDLN